ncbi:MAG: hypothetical protein Q8L49_11925 [Burkholderiaceae bacterium]|nr:hypothetical protein [Burkholderiaceae bacterium]
MKISAPAFCRSSARALAHQRAHRVALGQQLQRGGAAELAGGSDDQDHGQAFKGFPTWCKLCLIFRAKDAPCKRPGSAPAHWR